MSPFQRTIKIITSATFFTTYTFQVCACHPGLLLTYPSLTQVGAVGEDCQYVPGEDQYGPSERFGGFGGRHFVVATGEVGAIYIINTVIYVYCKPNLQYYTIDHDPEPG